MQFKKIGRGGAGVRYGTYLVMRLLVISNVTYPIMHVISLPPHPRTECQTPVKTLPSHKFIGGR